MNNDFNTNPNTNVNNSSDGRDASANEARRTTSKRGFAAMDPERQRQIAREGGRAAHQQGTAHKWTSEEARIAGRKGGEASRQPNRSNGENNDRNNGRIGM